MRYLTCSPGFPLGEFVDQFWYCENYSPPHPKERVLPGGAIDVILDLHHDRIPECDPANPSANALIAGPHARYLLIDTRSLRKLIGIHFRPFGTVPFLGMPAHEFAGRHVALDAIWGREADLLRDSLMAAPTPEACFRRLERFLLQRFREPCWNREAVRYAVAELGRPSTTATVAGISSRLGVTPKRLIRMFRDYVGLPPKLYGRIRRFQHVLRLAAEGRDIRWAEIAAGCGYYDQAHFIKDFQSFSGINPSRYVAGRAAWVNHVPVWD